MPYVTPREGIRVSLGSCLPTSHPL